MWSQTEDLSINCFVLGNDDVSPTLSFTYVTMEHKTSHKGTFCEI